MIRIMFCGNSQVVGSKLEFEGAELHLEKKEEYFARKKSERESGKKKDDEDSDGEEAAEGDGPSVAPRGDKKRGRDGAAAKASEPKKPKGADGEETGGAAVEGAEGGEKKRTFVPGVRLWGRLLPCHSLRETAPFLFQ